MDNNNNNKKLWPRGIVFVDMNAFFAAIEQHDFPELRGQPLAVTNGKLGTCIITCSYEARAFGIKTGMRLKQARQRCPSLIQCPSRPTRYAQVSSEIMHSLEQFTPDIEIFSVDEAFLNVTHCQRLWGTPPHIGRLVKEAVYQASGLLCSVGISGDKTTAKYAAQLKKPNGLLAVHPDEAREFLHDVPVEKLCGINKGTQRFLAQYGVRTCGDMIKIPISVLGKRFGNIGRRMWYMCQGADPDEIHSSIPSPKSLGHGKVLPPDTTDLTLLKTYLLHMSEKVAARLRHNQFVAEQFFIGLRNQQWGWLGGKYNTVIATDDGRLIYQLCQQMLAEHWSGQGINQVQVTALHPTGEQQQFDLFTGSDQQHSYTNTIVDNINARFGEFTLAPASLLGRSKMPNVIAPAWKPKGHRRSV